MVINSIDAILIWSENWQNLAKWYENTLELQVASRLNLEDDTGVNFKIGELYFWIGYHDKVSGRNKDRYRIMIAFSVDSVKATYEKLLAKNVRFISKPTLSPTKDFYVATAMDPEDNVIQFYSNKP